MKDLLSGRWYDVGDKLARDKVGQALRDGVKASSDLDDAQCPPAKFQKLDNDESRGRKRSLQDSSEAFNIPTKLENLKPTAGRSAASQKEEPSHPSGEFLNQLHSESTEQQFISQNTIVKPREAATSSDASESYSADLRSAELLRSYQDHQVLLAQNIAAHPNQADRDSVTKVYPQANMDARHVRPYSMVTWHSSSPNQYVSQQQAIAAGNNTAFANHRVPIVRNSLMSFNQSIATDLWSIFHTNATRSQAGGGHSDHDSIGEPPWTESDLTPNPVNYPSNSTPTNDDSIS